MSEREAGAAEDAIQQVVNIVSAYVSHNSMRAADLPEFIGAVHASIQQLAKGQAAPEAKPPETPAVPIKKSVSRDYIICLEDGKKFKSLRRHLSACYNLTPDEYRAKWNLPSDYPMVAPAYSATRSRLAKDSGLGQVSRSAEADADPTLADDADAAELNTAEITDDAAPDQPAETEVAASPEPEAEAPKKARRGRPKKSAD